MEKGDENGGRPDQETTSEAAGEAESADERVDDGETSSGVVDSDDSKETKEPVDLPSPVQRPPDKPHKGPASRVTQLRKRGGVPALLPSDGALRYLLLETKRARQAGRLRLGKEVVVRMRGYLVRCVEQALQRVAEHDRASGIESPTLRPQSLSAILPYIELVGAGHL